jgi:hypothetical protein
VIKFDLQGTAGEGASKLLHLFVTCCLHFFDTSQLAQVLVYSLTFTGKFSAHSPFHCRTIQSSVTVAQPGCVSATTDTATAAWNKHISGMHWRLALFTNLQSDMIRSNIFRSHQFASSAVCQHTFVRAIVAFHVAFLPTALTFDEEVLMLDDEAALDAPPARPGENRSDANGSLLLCCLVVHVLSGSQAMYRICVFQGAVDSFVEHIFSISTIFAC